MEQCDIARIGYMNQFEVIILTDDTDFIPHVHITDINTKGRIFNCSVMLEDSDYTSQKVNTFDDKQCKEFDEFMKQPHRNIHFRNNYEYAVNLWNDNNSSSYVQIVEDDNGDIIMPDYKRLNG